jgi:hypothetical protein
MKFDETGQGHVVNRVSNPIKLVERLINVKSLKASISIRRANTRMFKFEEASKSIRDVKL